MNNTNTTKLRSDRRKLLKFILESAGQHAPAHTILDDLDVERVLEAVRNGGPFNFEALKANLVMIDTLSSIDRAASGNDANGHRRSGSNIDVTIPRLPTGPATIPPTATPNPVPSPPDAPPAARLHPHLERSRNVRDVDIGSITDPAPPIGRQSLTADARPGLKRTSAVTGPAPPMPADNSPPPQPDPDELPLLASGLTQEQQRLLAYVLTYACCHAQLKSPQSPLSHCASALLDALCIDPLRAQAIARHLDLMQQAHMQKTQGRSNRPSPLRPRTLVLLTLLERVKPADFQHSMPAFLAWRRDLVRLVASCCRLAVAGTWKPTVATLITEEQVLAKLEEQVQVLQQLALLPWCEQEHSRAVEKLKQQVQTAASNSSAGYTFPRQVQLQVVALLEGAAGALEPGAAQLLQECLYRRPPPLESLDVGDVQLACCQALGALRQYQFARAMGMAGGRLAAVLSHLIRLADTLAAQGPGVAELDVQLAQQVAGRVQAMAQEELIEQLTAAAGAQRRGEPLTLLVDLQGAASRVTGRNSDVQVLPALVQAGAHNSWEGERQQLAAAGAGEAEVLCKIGGGIVARLQQQAASLKGMAALGPAMPNLAAVAALEYYKLYGELLGAYLEGLNSREGTTDEEGNLWLLPYDQEALAVIQAAVVLERQLAAYVGQCMVLRQQLPAARWRIGEQLQPALMYVVTTRNQLFQESFQRLMAQPDEELWRPVGKDASYSQTALEIERMVGASLQVLLKLQGDLGGLVLPWSVVSLHLANVEHLLDDYANFVLNMLDEAGAEDELLPAEVPQQLLYSQPDNERLVAQELLNGSCGVAELLGPDGQLVDRALASFPRRRAAPTLEALTTQRLCVMMESVWHLQRLCSKEPPSRPPLRGGGGGIQASGRLSRTFLQQLRTDWFAEAGAHGAANLAASTRARADMVLDNALEAARDKLYTAAGQVAAFLATKLVLWEQRALWLELLLRHPVPGRADRMQLPLRALVLPQDPRARVLPPGCKTIVEMLKEAFDTLTTRELMFELFPQSLLRAACTAVERVLLEGGPARMFSPEITDELARDLQCMHDIFVNKDGEGGVQEKFVDKEMMQLLKVVTLMRLPREELLRRLDGASGGGDEDLVVYRVAVHRADAVLAKELAARYRVGYFDMRRQRVAAVIGRLPGWLAGAGWSRRR